MSDFAEMPKPPAKINNYFNLILLGPLSVIDSGYFLWSEESKAKNVEEVILVKQWNGPISTVEVAFMKEYSEFGNLERR